MVDPATAIATGGALIGGFLDYKSGKDSAKAMAEAYQQIQKDAREDAQVAAGMADPFQQYRGEIAQQLSGILSGEIDFTTDPGYQFRMGEAMRETERAAAARGFNRSGNVMASLNQRAQDVATAEYDRIINRLTNLAGAGSQNAIAGGQTYGSLLGNVYGAQVGAAANQAQAGGGMGALIGGAAEAIGDLF